MIQTVTDRAAVRTHRRDSVAARRRRVHRSRESSPLQVAAAVDAAGVVLLERRSRRAYLQLVEHVLAEQRRRADFRASVLAVVGVLLLCTDWASRTTRPTRRVMAARGDVIRSERTVTRVIRWLQEAGLLATVAQGRRGEFAPGGAWSTTNPDQCTGQVEGDHQPANEAAVYALTQPGLTVSPPSRSPYVEETKSPRAREGDPHSEPLRGRPVGAAPPHADRSRWEKLRQDPMWSLRATPRRKGRRLVAAERMRHDTLSLRPMTANAIASVAFPFFEAGWTTGDVLFAVDHKLTTNSPWPYEATEGVKRLRDWMASRLQDWTDDAGHPVKSRSQRQEIEQVEAQRRRREAAEERARHRAERDRNARSARRLRDWYRTRFGGRAIIEQATPQHATELHPARVDEATGEGTASGNLARAWMLDVRRNNYSGSLAEYTRANADAPPALVAQWIAAALDDPTAAGCLADWVSATSSPHHETRVH